MIKIYLTALAIFFAMQSTAQKAHVTYYNSKYKEVSEDKARYVKTVIHNNDGTTTTKEMDLRSGKETMNQTYKGDEPYGVWLSRSWGAVKGAQNDKLDYNFDLIYDSTTSCVVDPDLVSIQDYLEDDAQFRYEAPQLIGVESFNQYLAMNLRYPAPSKEQGLQGRVVAMFTVTKDGRVKDIRIKKSAHICLDKEYARILRGLKFDKPPTLNGKPVEVCAIAPAVFRLE